MKVLLTRLLEDSQRSAERYHQAGFESLFLPLFERRVLTTPIPVPTPKAAFDFTVFTSSAAVEVLHDEANEALQNLTSYAVGPRTAERLAGKSYKDVRIGDGSAANLADMIQTDLISISEKSPSSTEPAMGLYPCGKVRSFDFQSTFEGHKEMAAVRLIEWEVYENCPLDPGKAAFLQTVDGYKPLVIPLYSPMSAAHFFELATRYDAETMLADCVCIAISRRCADQVPHGYRGHLLVAEHPDEESMIQAAVKLRS